MADPSPDSVLDEEAAGSGEAATAPFSPPAPAEVLLALGKNLTPRWRQCQGPAATPAPVEREQAALRLGVIGTECLLASMSRDEQHAAQMLSDAAALEKLLGITEAVRARHLRLLGHASANEWEPFRREADALLQERADALAGQRDPDLARLLPLGAWFRLMEVEIVLVTEDQNPGRVLVSIHPHLLDWLDEELALLEPATRAARSVARCQHASERLRRLAASSDPATSHATMRQVLQDTVTRLHTP